MKIKIFGKEIDILVIIFAVLAVATVILLLRTYLPVEENLDEYKKTSSVVSAKEELPDNPINFDSLNKENPDVCGWIRVEGTDIDYPVMRSGANTEEDFYLTHDWHRETQKAGSIYIQQLNSADFSDKNTVIYGHNMKNGTMFGQVKRFKDKEFFDKNSKITVYTEGHILEYQIYASRTIDDNHIMYAYDFSTDEGFQGFISDTLSSSAKIHNVRTGTAVTVRDKIITLSTCTSNNSERLIVAAVLKSDTLTK
ncbi:MAG: class B sortase [Clostridiales bacterium]|nr:class B sortase [Candidatus Equinaster intestinalis]